MNSCHAEDTVVGTLGGGVNEHKTHIQNTHHTHCTWLFKDHNLKTIEVKVSKVILDY